VTVVPTCTWLPGAGASDAICPAGTLLEDSDCTVTARPAAWSSCLAAAAVDPTTLGTATTCRRAGGPGLTTGVVLPDSEIDATTSATTATSKAAAANSRASGQRLNGLAPLQELYDGHSVLEVPDTSTRGGISRIGGARHHRSVQAGRSPGNVHSPACSRSFGRSDDCDSLLSAAIGCAISPRSDCAAIRVTLGP
jgi:hypothetical protein